jgi:N,N-dimethylformamidase
MRPKMNDQSSADGLGYAHGLKADLQVAGWLDQVGLGFDVAADEDLHRDGLARLAPYRTVLTGTHPEYWTEAMLDAAEAYLAGGGRFVYLGGNGFYWVTSFDPAGPHVIEVRRSNGSRAWSAVPGEYRHSTTGEVGGLWRERGRAPQRLAGVGFAGQGAGRAQPYRRTPAASDPRAAWIFDSVPDESFGDEGLVMDGAAGFEIDRADTALGTPPHALVVATATGFSDQYQHAIEEVPMSDSRQGGTVEPRVRADLVFFETPNGGAVFSVGSIAYAGALFVRRPDGSEGPISRITRNVLTRFLDARPFPE